MKPKPPNEPTIFTLREQRVVLDADLAQIYGVPTKQFNQAFKRNQHRFPTDFAFQMTAQETNNLRSQFAASRPPNVGNEGLAPNWSQIVTSSNKHRGKAYRPWVFTEHGALMAANILRSERAVEMSVYVVRAFLRQRALLATSAEILRRLEQIDSRLLEHDEALVIVWNKIKEMMRPTPSLPPKSKPRIGFRP